MIQSNDPTEPIDRRQQQSDPAHRKPRGFKRLLPALLLMGCFGCIQQGSEGPNPTAAVVERGPVRADVLQVAPIRWPLVVRSQGTLATDEITVVGTKVAGRVDLVEVDLGDEVTPKTVLMSLDRRELELEAKQAEAALLQARAAVGLLPDAPLEELDPVNSPPVREAQAVLDEARLKRERVERLRLQRAVTEAEWEGVAALEKVAEAQLASALNAVNEKIALIRVRSAELAMSRQRLAEAVITAPFCGVVQQRHVAPGTYVQVGQAIVTLVRTNPLRFRGTLPERYARRLTIGMPVQVLIDSIGEPLRSKVNRISPSLDPASRALTFEADLDNSDGRLRAGLFAEARVELDEHRQALVVPEGAINEFAGMEKVWRVAGGQCSEHPVATGERRNGKVEILEGLTAGETILLEARAGRRAPVQIQTVFVFREGTAELIAQATPRDPEAAAPTDGVQIVARPAPPDDIPQEAESGP